KEGASVNWVARTDPQLSPAWTQGLIPSQVSRNYCAQSDIDEVAHKFRALRPDSYRRCSARLSRDAIDLICPLLSGPSTIIVWTTKEEWNGSQAQARGDHRQNA